LLLPGAAAEVILGELQWRSKKTLEPWLWYHVRIDGCSMYWLAPWDIYILQEKTLDTLSTLFYSNMKFVLDNNSRTQHYNK
jgi:hypothetical protein